MRCRFCDDIIEPNDNMLIGIRSPDGMVVAEADLCPICTRRWVLKINGQVRHGKGRLRIRAKQATERAIVMQAVTDNPGRNATQIASETGLSYEKVRMFLKDLEREKMVKGTWTYGRGREYTPLCRNL